MTTDDPRGKSEWSEAFLALAGSMPDFPSVDELRRGYGPDSPREDFDFDDPSCPAPGNRES